MFELIFIVKLLVYLLSARQLQFFLILLLGLPGNDQAFFSPVVVEKKKSSLIGINSKKRAAAVMVACFASLPVKQLNSPTGTLVTLLRFIITRTSRRRRAVHLKSLPAIIISWE